jgi:hypothetical protein
VSVIVFDLDRFSAVAFECGVPHAGRTLLTAPTSRLLPREFRAVDFRRPSRILTIEAILDDKYAS